MYKVLITSTSFQDTPGEHQKMLEDFNAGYDYMRGPLKESDLIPIIGNYDGIICSDDEYSKAVLEKGRSGRLKIISKYGVGLDSFDLDAANELGIAIRNCPGVNEQSVAEHVMALILTFYKNITFHSGNTKQGKWIRTTGEEIAGKTLGIVGFGNIGRRVAMLGANLGMKIGIYDPFIDSGLEDKKGDHFMYYSSLIDLIGSSEILTIHVPLTADTKDLFGEKEFKSLNPNTLVVNTSRANLINQENLLTSLKENRLRGYLCDVMPEEPMDSDSPLAKFENVLITPHIASRTKQAVERQGKMAVENLFNHFQTHFK